MDGDGRMGTDGKEQKRREGEELSDTARAMRQVQPWIDAVWRFLGGVVVGVGGGWALDRWLGTSPWFLLGLSVVGLGVGFYGFVVSALKLGQQQKKR